MTVYVALLRGINVGGANKVPMKALKDVFESLGLASVRTYIASGNVVFASRETDRNALAHQLQSAIEAHFGFAVRVLVRDIAQIRAIVTTIPEGWTNDAAMKCDVVFLGDEFDTPDVLGQLPFRPEIEDVLYTPGAIVHRIDRVNATRSGLPRIVGTPLYKQATVRNCNTARKLLELMDAVE